MVSMCKGNLYLFMGWSRAVANSRAAYQYNGVLIYNTAGLVPLKVNIFSVKLSKTTSVG